MKRQSILMLITAAALVGCGGPMFTATLSGGAEVPAVTTSATGSATGTLDGTKLDVTGNYSGLSGAATAAHIHGPADATATASVACPLTVTESATAGTGTLSGECTTLVVADLNSGMYYVNIHTTAHGGGEIRGQLMKK
ncbi:MAG TPA: CHRD domain-containing protein [Myxococcales bacterium]|jgi:hypothetical protein|nr:CHRD domain-containing protein [Myxococcales bacterium]